MTNANTRWPDKFLDAKRLQTDPLADETLEQLLTENGMEEAKRIFDLLIRNIEMPVSELPPGIQHYLQQTRQLPKWADTQKIALAQDLFLDHGPKFLIFLYYKSLPLLYACKNGAQVLVQTSRLTRREESVEIFTRRIAETGQFLLEVMRPDGLLPDGKGIQAIQKVRLIHAAIRKFIPADNWTIDEFGQPINQEDMAVTLMTFSVAMTDALTQFHIQESEEKLEAYLHTWTAIGSLLGVDADLLPKNRTEAQWLLERILQRQAAPSEAGKLLTEALLSFAKKTIPKERFDDAPQVLIRFLIGKERSKMLSVPQYSGCLTALLPGLLYRMFQKGEQLEDHSDGAMRTLLDALSVETVKRMVGYFDSYKQRHFEVPEAFERAWF